MTISRLAVALIASSFAVTAQAHPAALIHQHHESALSIAGLFILYLLLSAGIAAGLKKVVVKIRKK